MTTQPDWWKNERNEIGQLENTDSHVTNAYARQLPDGAWEYAVTRWHYGRPALLGVFRGGGHSVSESCTWTKWPDVDTWDTQCGDAFVFIDGTPTENSMKFCCYCGKPLMEKQASQEEFEDVWGREDEPSILAAGVLADAGLIKADGGEV